MKKLLILLMFGMVSICSARSENYWHQGSDEGDVWRSANDYEYHYERHFHENMEEGIKKIFLRRPRIRFTSRLSGSHILFEKMCRCSSI